MSKLKITALCFTAALFLVIQSCNKRNETKISAAGGTKSHNMGQNCMNCHVSGGRGEGWFNAAGTAYSSITNTVCKNPVVQLYTERNGGGQLVATINGDAYGNFYTTESINFGSGLYPVVTGGGANFMTQSITQGACNSCHGVSTAQITAD